MAMFREHIGIGAIVAMVVTVGAYVYAITIEPYLLLLLFGVTTLGSILPDVDSDSGMPFYLVYGTATLTVTGLVVLYVMTYPPENPYILFGVPFTVFLFVWFVIGGIFKRFTSHRGIFHSIPMMGIAGLGTIMVSERLGFVGQPAYILGAGMAIGYLTHLVLDELHSTVNFEGIPFLPKKSLGTALKFFSSSTGVNVATYTTLVLLWYSVQPIVI